MTEPLYDVHFREEKFEDFYESIKGFMNIYDPKEALRKAFEAGWSGSTDLLYDHLLLGILPSEEDI